MSWLSVVCGSLWDWRAFGCFLCSRFAKPLSDSAPCRGARQLWWAPSSHCCITLLPVGSYPAVTEKRVFNGVRESHWKCWISAVVYSDQQKMLLPSSKMAGEEWVVPWLGHWKGGEQVIKGCFENNHNPLKSSKRFLMCSFGSLELL